MMNRIIVVIGASRGIGEALVNAYALDAQNIVIAFSRNVERMRQNFQQSNVISAYADLTSTDLHQQLEEVLKDYAEIDILINNAGAIVNKPFMELKREEIDLCYQTNSVGTIYATQYFVPKMLEKGGHILNISTMGAFQGSVKFPGLSAYSTSKAGITSFTELFAEEYKETKIRMNCLCLGAVQTEMLEEAFPRYQAPINPTEIAQFIVNFSFTGNQFFNGKILPVSSTTP